MRNDLGSKVNGVIISRCGGCFTEGNSGHRTLTHFLARGFLYHAHSMMCSQNLSTLSLPVHVLRALLTSANSCIRHSWPHLIPNRRSHSESTSSSCACVFTLMGRRSAGNVLRWCADMLFSRLGCCAFTLKIFLHMENNFQIWKGLTSLGDAAYPISFRIDKL